MVTLYGGKHKSLERLINLFNQNSISFDKKCMDIQLFLEMKDIH